MSSGGDSDSQQVKRFGTVRRWSDAVVHGNMAYFVEVPDDPEAGALEQFKMILQQVDSRLAQVGSDKTKLLSVLIYMPNPQDLGLFNQLWDSWVPYGHAPVRACTHPQLAAPGYRVELVVTAAI